MTKRAAGEQALNILRSMLEHCTWLDASPGIHPASILIDQDQGVLNKYRSSVVSLLDDAGIKWERNSKGHCGLL